MKVDITSTAVEKGIDAAKEFLQKLVAKPIEEIGLLITDNIRLWRFNNQLRILQKADYYIKSRNLQTKQISLKILVPLLENASLEENEFLQDKWVVLLSNMVDSEQNIENHVFPFLLGQISKSEFMILEEAVFLTEHIYLNFKSELETFKIYREKEELILKEKIEKIDDSSKDYNLRQTKWRLKIELKELERKESKIKSDMLKPVYFPGHKLQEFEVANLIRLGLIKSIPQHSAYTSGAEIRNKPYEEYLILDALEIEISNEDDLFIMTELGSLFIQACHEKK